MEEGRDPSQERVGSAGRDLVANVVFDFGLIDNLDRQGSARLSSSKHCGMVGFAFMALAISHEMTSELKDSSGLCKPFD